MRILDWPRDLAPERQEPISGPQSVTSNGSTGANAFQQTTSSPFGLWVWKLTFPVLRDRGFKQYRGWFTAMSRGGNISRWQPDDPDRLTFKEVGVNFPGNHHFDARPTTDFSNGMHFSNGTRWENSRQWVPITKAVPKGATQIRLDDVHWGRKIEKGEIFGFLPFHHAVYIVEDADIFGNLSIWPPLRKELKPGDFATLRPSMMVRMLPNSGGSLERDNEVARGLEITLVELEHDYVVRFY